MRQTLSTIIRTVVGLLGIAVFLSALGYCVALPKKEIDWGINYSSLRAVDLEMEPLPLFRTILDDLSPAVVRLPAYWEELEPSQDQFNFSMIDSLLAETDKRNTKVLLVVGLKQPRWPECHQPTWSYSLSPDQQDEAVLKMINKTVDHLKTHSSIAAWQVENEPFFKYGPDCPTISQDLYKKELAEIRKLDNRPLVGTDSGEKGIWITTAWSGVDVMGATMYREVYADKKNRYETYPLPAWTYNVKAGLVRLLSGANKTIGVELQAEPWFTGGNAQSTPVDEQLKHMNAEIFNRNVAYAQKTGLSENYLWGAEWWYWMKQKQNNSTLVDAAKQLFNQ